MRKYVIWTISGVEYQETDKGVMVGTGNGHTCQHVLNLKLNDTIDKIKEFFKGLDDENNKMLELR